MNRILLIEDHERLAQLIEQQLELVGIAVDIFDRIDLAWSAIQQMSYQVIILDRGLPDGDGLTLLKRMRAAGITIPCLVLTARDALHDRIDGLDQGADDYLTKPFAMDELIARVKVLLRRPPISAELQPAFGDLVIKPDQGVLCCKSESVALAPAEIQIMLLLIRKQGEVARRTALEAAGWGLSEAVTPNALDVVLHRLRKKMLAIHSTMQILNLRSHGYALR